ncbi:MAG: amidase [Myxococcota bacterium]
MLFGILFACSRTVVEAPVTDLPAQSATELRRRLQSGELTAQRLAEASLAAIEATNTRGPELRAVIAVDSHAPEAAAWLDRRGPSGTLHGLPVLVKDNIDVMGLPTTAGSRALAEHRPTDDAFLVASLRQAGAVLIGKANLSEWANFRSTKSSSGWSAMGGQTRNPHALDHSPCGSSSGSAVAVAAGLVPLAVGTETDGSILCPASVNGIVGVKPTVGLVSRDGIVPISASQDTAGPMARTVADAALLLQAMVTADPTDPASAKRPDNLDTNYVSALRTDALRSVRIGVFTPAGFHAATLERFRGALTELEAAGAVLVPLEPPESEAMKRAEAQEFDVLLYEFSRGLADYLREVDGYQRLDDLIAYNQAHSDDELKWFGQELFERASSHPADPAAWQAAREGSQRFFAAFLDERLQKHDLKAIVTPTTGPAWPIDLKNGDRPSKDTTGFTAVSGYPAVTVPMGKVGALPVGLSFLGPAWSEARLLGLAHAYEHATRPSVP